MSYIFALIAFTILSCPIVNSQHALQTVKQWKLFTYNFPAHAPKHNLSFYNPLNVVATCITVAADRIFIATPQLFSGVPATVSVVSKRDFGNSPVLQAYPDWSFSTNGRQNVKCSDLVLISVYRLRIDSCNRLWILDAGISRSFEDSETTCPPKILVVDLATNMVVRRIDFPEEVLRNQSLLTNLVIDETTSTSHSCNDVFVYISDTVRPAILVYDSENNFVWRMTHAAMRPDPQFEELRILNDRFTVMDGIIGLAFDDRAGVLYFQPLATDRIFSISRGALRTRPFTAASQELPVKLVGKKSSQGLGLAYSHTDDSLIFSPLSETVIAAWHPRSNRHTVLDYDRERLQFVADISTSHFEPGIIYAVSSKFQRFFLKTVSPAEINTRIIRINLYANAAASYGATRFPAYFHSLVGQNVPVVANFNLSNAASASPYGGAKKLLGVHNYAGGVGDTFAAMSVRNSIAPALAPRAAFSSASQAYDLRSVLAAQSSGYFYRRPA